LLTQFQEHPDAWQRVPVIIQESTNPQNKVLSVTLRQTSPFALIANAQFLGLQILEKVVRTRWKALPDDQRAGAMSQPARIFSLT